MFGITLWLTLGVAISTSYPRFFHGGLYHFVRVHHESPRSNTSEAILPFRIELPITNINHTRTNRPLIASHQKNDKADQFCLDETVHKTQDHLTHVANPLGSAGLKTQDPWVHFITRGNISKLDIGKTYNATTTETTVVGNATIATGTAKVNMNYYNSTDSKADVHKMDIGRTDSNDTKDDLLHKTGEQRVKRVRKDSNIGKSEELKYLIFKQMKELCDINKIPKEYCRIMIVNESVEVIPVGNLTNETVPIVNLIEDTTPIVSSTTETLPLVKPTNVTFPLLNLTIDTTVNLSEQTISMEKHTKERISTVNLTQNPETLGNLIKVTSTLDNLTKENTTVNQSEETTLLHFSTEMIPKDFTLPIIHPLTLLKRIKRVTNNDENSIAEEEIESKKENQTRKSQTSIVSLPEAINVKQVLNTSFPQPVSTKQNLTIGISEPNKTSTSPEVNSTTVTETTPESVPKPENTSHGTQTTNKISISPEFNSTSDTETTPKSVPKPENTSNRTQTTNTTNQTQATNTIDVTDVVSISNLTQHFTPKTSGVNLTHRSKPVEDILTAYLNEEDDDTDTSSVNKTKDSSKNSLKPVDLNKTSPASNRVYNTTETTERTVEVFEVPKGMDEDGNLKRIGKTFATSAEPRTQSNGEKFEYEAEGKQHGALKKLDIPASNHADKSSVETKDFIANGDVMKALVIPIFLVVLMGALLFAMHNMSRYFVQRTNNRQSNVNNEQRQVPTGTDVIQLNVITDNPNVTIDSTASSGGEGTEQLNETSQTNASQSYQEK